MKPLLLSLLFIAPLCAQIIDVTTLGAVPDGKTDNTAILTKAFASAKPGTEFWFPCGTKGNNYLVTQTISFPSNVTIAGSHGLACHLLYSSSSYNNAAFSFVNASNVVMRDMGMFTSASGTAPGAVVILGGAAGSGHHLLEEVNIGGYAQKAFVYSIASEMNAFLKDRFDIYGGGAGIGFYTSAADDFSLCSACQAGTNRNLKMDESLFNITVTTPFTGIEDKLENGTGDHFYRNGSMGALNNAASSAFTFISGDANHAGVNWPVIVGGFHVGGGGYGFILAKDVQPVIYNLDIHDNTWDTGVPGAVGFIQGQTGLLISNSRFEQNLGENHSPNSKSNIDQLAYSVMLESYGPITINTQATNNYFATIGAATVVLPASATGNVIYSPSTNQN